MGSHLALRMRNDYKVWTTHFRHAHQIKGVTDLPLGVGQIDWIRELVFSVQPELIIYAAGNHDPLWAEDIKNAKEMELVQVTGPTAVVASSQLLGSRMIYLSSAMVFDGSRGNYHEGDVVLPSTALGKAKVNGENAVKSRSLDYLILRSPPLLGRGPACNPSLLDRWSWTWNQNRPVELDHLVRHSYATIEPYCDWVLRCIEAPIKNKTLHFGGLSKLTEYELGCLVAEKLKVPKSLVIRKPSQANASASAMTDYSLNFTQAVRNLEVKPLLLKQSLDLLQKHLLITGL